MSLIFTTTTMSPFLPRSILKRKDSTTNPFSPQHPLSTPPSCPTSPSTPYSLSTPPRRRIPNTDALPPSADALEGLLNARSSQLQKLAHRVESVNEWLEMDGIVLAKLIQDITAQVDKEEEAERVDREAAERARALWKENNATVPAASRGPVSPGQYRGMNGGSGRVGGGHGRVSSGESRVPEVFFKGLSLCGKSKDERVNENYGVRELRERIKAMKKWRREIERTVCWQREEYRRVREAINRQSAEGEGSGVTEGSVARRIVQFEDDENVEGKDKDGAEPVKTMTVHRDEGWGIGGQTWEKKSGRVPSQSEWEDLFSDGRIGWDEKRVRQWHGGC